MSQYSLQHRGSKDQFEARNLVFFAKEAVDQAAQKPEESIDAWLKEIDKPNFVQEDFLGKVDKSLEKHKKAKEKICNCSSLCFNFSCIQRELEHGVPAFRNIFCCIQNRCPGTYNMVWS